MTGLSTSPRLLKGAIVGVDPVNPLASVVVFQYNPETLERSMRPSIAGDGAERGEVLRLSGPPRKRSRSRSRSTPLTSSSGATR